MDKPIEARITHPETHPLDQFDTSWDGMDPVFEESFARALDGWPGTRVTAFFTPIDLYLTKDHLVIRANLPGVKNDGLDISIGSGLLKIKGETGRDEDDLGEELPSDDYGHFQRTVSLPKHVDTEGVETVFEDGVLVVTIPIDPEENQAD